MSTSSAKPISIGCEHGIPGQVKIKLAPKRRNENIQDYLKVILATAKDGLPSVNITFIEAWKAIKASPDTPTRLKDSMDILCPDDSEVFTMLVNIPNDSSPFAAWNTFLDFYDQHDAGTILRTTIGFYQKELKNYPNIDALMTDLHKDYSTLERDRSENNRSRPKADRITAFVGALPTEKSPWQEWFMLIDQSNGGFHKMTYEEITASARKHYHNTVNTSQDALIAETQKTVCKYWRKGTCNRQNCPFLHPPDEEGSEKDKNDGSVKGDNKQICFQFERTGECDKANCPYVHSRGDEPDQENNGDGENDRSLGKPKIQSSQSFTSYAAACQHRL